MPVVILPVALLASLVHAAPRVLAPESARFALHLRNQAPALRTGSLCSTDALLLLPSRDEEEGQKSMRRPRRPIT